MWKVHFISHFPPNGLIFFKNPLLNGHKKNKLSGRDISVCTDSPVFSGQLFIRTYGVLDFILTGNRQIK